MNFLLFLISSIFAGIFYTFYRVNLGEKVYLGGQEHFVGISSISGNLFVEAIVFMSLGIFLFFSFSSFSLFSKKQEEEIDEAEDQGPGLLSGIYQDFNFNIFFKKYLYYIGFICFYSAIYLILGSFGVSDFSYFILFLNIIISALFFLTSKAELFRDFIKINTILFSLYYIIYYVYSLFIQDNGIIFIDIINTIFILSFFIIHIYSDSKILKRKDSDSVLILYFFLYLFIVLTYYSKALFDFSGTGFLYIITCLGVGFNILIYFFLQKLNFLKNSKYTLRALSFLFLYISTIFGIFLLISDTGEFFNTIAISLILIYSIIFNYRVHQEYQNYISLFFSTASGVFILYFLVYKYCLFTDTSFLKWEIIITFFISLSLVISTYIYKTKYNQDYFFLHICAYLVNILGIIYYFYHVNFIVLDFGIILLLDSILIFLSYFKLKKLK